MKMPAQLNRPPEKLEKRVEAYAAASGLSRPTLLRALKTWRRLQSSASEMKSPAYSGEQIGIDEGDG
jgi:hypothetical protein